MSKSNLRASWLALALDRQAADPLHTQLAQAIRDLVHDGRLQSGDRLPASRALAEDLSVSRLTVTTAYGQLEGEGYLVGRQGAGTFVAPDLANLPPPPRHTAGPDMGAPPRPARAVPFDTGTPDVAEFPHRRWARLFELVWRSPDTALLGRADPAGWPPLRAALARHLLDWRGIRCAPDQVVITAGLGDAVDLIARLGLSRGDRVAVEEPGFGPLRAALAGAGLAFSPVPVDTDGIDAGLLGPDTAAVVVTPSRQYPLGMTLPLARRLRLLAWAEASGGLVIEDDFDGEYRYQGQPLPAMMRLDEAGRVIYLGSFSKVMFPGLRLGFLVVPRRLVAPMQAALARRGSSAAIVAQPVLARFIEEGGFATHLRRMRRIYGRRQRALVAALARHCAGLLQSGEATAGMHLVAELSPALAARMTDAEASRRAAAAGVTAQPLSPYYAGPPTRQGLVLSFAGFPESAIEQAARRLGVALMP